jgi:hypothetical protein
MARIGRIGMKRGEIHEDTFTWLGTMETHGNATISDPRNRS